MLGWKSENSIPVWFQIRSKIYVDGRAVNARSFLHTLTSKSICLYVNDIPRDTSEN
jgi:hypothetical protein